MRIEDMTKDEVKQRVLSFMLYKGYIGDNAISEKKLLDDMEKEGWFEKPYAQILGLIREKEKRENKGEEK